MPFKGDWVHSRFFCGSCWRQGLLAIQGRLGSLQVFGGVLVGGRDFLPFKGDWVHSRFLVWFLLETGTSCHSRATGFTTGFWCRSCWRQGLLAIQGRLGSFQVFGVVLVGDRDFLPFKGDWVHSRFLVWFLLETGTSCHSRATGFTPGFWCGPCWRQGLLAIRGRLSSLQVFGVVLVRDRDFLPFKGDWVHSRFLVWSLLETGTSCHSRATGFTPGFWCGSCWRQGLLAIQGRLGSLQVFGVVLVGDRDFLPFEGDWVHSRFLVWSLLETGTSCHSRATGFAPGFWCGPCWRQGLLAIQGRLGSLQVFGVVLVGDRDFLPFKGD